MISRIAVISLAKAEHRRKLVEAQGSQCPYPYDIIDAIDGATLDMDALKKEGKSLYDSWHERWILPGEVACTLSHGLAWKSVKPGEFVLILEDDLVLRESCMTYLNALTIDAVINQLHMDLCVLHSHQEKREDREQVGEFLWKSKYEYGGTAAYALNYRTAQKMLSHLELIDTMTDGILNRVSREVSTYIAIPFIGSIHFHSEIGQRSFRSS